MATTQNQKILVLQVNNYQKKNSIHTMTSEIVFFNTKVESLTIQVNSLNGQFDSLNGRFDSLQSTLNKWMNHYRGPTSSDHTSHFEGTNSSYTMVFHSKPLHHDLYPPKVDVNKFNGSDPMGWVTQMEHYFSLQ
jgi:hypothetical protein